MEYTYEQARLCATQNNYRAEDLRLDATLTADQWLRAIEYFNYSCAICECEFNDKNRIHADHWIPISYEGDNNPGTVATNIIPLCQRCNSSKNAKWPEVWIKKHYSEDDASGKIKKINDYFIWVANGEPFPIIRYRCIDITKAKIILPVVRKYDGMRGRRLPLEILQYIEQHDIE